MAEYGAPVRADWVPVTIRVKVPAGISGVEAFDLTERRILALNLKIKFDRDYRPVAIRPPRAEQEEFRRSESQLFVVRAWVDPQDIARLKDQSYVHHVSRDDRLEPFVPTEPAMAQPTSALQGALARVDCGANVKADGMAADVVRDLGVARIWAAGYTGRGIVVGVVDGGITAHGRASQFGAWPAIPQPPALGEVIGGWPPVDWGTTAEGWGQHGNMIAFDVQAMAPEAELWDIRIWQPAVKFETYVSNAEQGYRLAIDHYKVHGVPHILVNSWGVYDSDKGPDYAFNPTSHIALLIEEALDTGILILFAAGNCGDGCPFTSGSLCGYGNRGSGSSILGPNGHPKVMTVGAATLKGEWCGYTSQGPAALPPNDPDKPDFCSISQFEGFFPNESGLRPYDGGTSAATGIAAGVVALLKQARHDLTQEECKRLLIETARPIRTPAAQGGAGAGIIDALRAFRSL
jgi:serine protease AprX